MTKDEGCCYLLFYIGYLRIIIIQGAGDGLNVRNQPPIAEIPPAERRKPLPNILYLAFLSSIQKPVTSIQHRKSGIQNLEL